jgi:cobalt/nickel transport system permease protein
MDKPYQHRSSVLQSLSEGRSLLARIDPRLRIVVATVFAVFVAVAQQPAALWLSAVMAALACALCDLPVIAVAKRLIPLNVLMLVLAVLLALGSVGRPLLVIGPLGFSEDGLRLAGTIALKGNTILLAMLAFLGSMEPATLGHALSHLRVPDRLAHLLLFTIRYVDVLHREMRRMRNAMKARAFRPGLNWHTYRSYGYLVGMLLVRSLERAERVSAAMKCRGFRGRFYLLEHFAFSWIDAVFAAAAMLAAATIAAAEWLL